MAINVFVSYSEKDHLAATLVSTLRGNPQIRVFIAHQVRTPGMSISEKVNVAIEQSQVFLLLWTERSESSEWVAYEIETALRLRKHIFPVLVEDIELPQALRDIEAVPLYRDSDHYMHLIGARLNSMATRPSALGSILTGLARAGVVAALGSLAAAWSNSGGEAPASSEKTRDPSEKTPSEPEKKPARARRKSVKKPRKS